MPNTGTVVIGGGVSGLSVAIMLADRGEDVTILEQAEELGTTVRGFSRHGVNFDTGLHYLGAVGEGELLRRLIGNLLPGSDIGFEPMNSSGYDRYLFDGGEVRFCCGTERAREALLETFPRERAAIDSYLGVLESCYPSTSERFAIGQLTMSDVLELIGGPSLWEYLHGVTDDRRLIDALCAPCVLHGTPPAKVPLRFHGLVAGTYLHSAHRVRGGGEALVDAFTTRLADLGVTAHCSTRVTAIDLGANGAVRGVRTSEGEYIPCRNCVLTGHPSLLRHLLPDGAVPSSVGRRLSRIRDTSSAYTLYGVLDEACDELAGCNLMVDRNASQEDTTDGEWLGPCFISASSCADEEAGFSVIWQAKGDELSQWKQLDCGVRPSEYYEVKQRTLEKIEAFVRSHCGHYLGDFQVVAGATPLTYRDYLGSPGGSLYGVRHRVGNPGLTPRMGIDGFYLSGQAVVVAPGVLGAVLAAVTTCREMVGSESMREVWK